MSVPRGPAALARLRSLLDTAQPDQPYLETEPLPASLTSAPPDRWLWLSHDPVTDDPGAAVSRPDGADDGPVATRPPLRDPQAYALGDLAGPGLLHQPPDVALSGTGALTPAQVGYARFSVDVTMKGGTTSGVVYPLVLCELARRFRLRNVGGASAGAIAASLAAAAELGRTRWDDAGRPDLAALADRARRQGRLRPGFVGLADAAAWFSQADDPGGEEYRIAQLFRPAAPARALFRLVVAGMRARWIPLVALLMWSISLRSRVLNALVLALAPVLAVVGTAAPAVYGPLAAWLFAGLVLACGSAALLCALVGVVGLRRGTTDHRHDPRLAEPVLTPVARTPRSPWLTLTAAAILIVAVAALSRTGGWAQIGGWRLLGAWLFGFVGVLVVVVAALIGTAAHAKNHEFGLISGSTRSGGAGRGLGDALAGLAPPTLDHALVPWLDTALSDLAGLGEPTVLRFGHLWLGPDYHPPDPVVPRTAEQLARLRQAAEHPRRRVVNLELITTELVHGVPYRFPLRCDPAEPPGRDDDRDPARPERLFLRRADLGVGGTEVFPPDVVDALCPASNRLSTTPFDVDTGKPVDDLFALPEPWDLPVLFAARLSLALPGLFQAVRVYRLVQTQPARDDYGVRIQHDGADLTYPAGEDQAWVQELWFSDGGITSNFPVHLFDTPLPLWPTVGIDLGRHPPGAAHQDVWLPSPARPENSPASPQRGSLVHFATSVLGTALGWSDTEQTFMPAFRGRVAWVRHRPGEGGVNLFMSSATIASLALRGVLAGRRLAERYGSDAHWQVHQWLRLRVALDSLTALRDRVGRAGATPPYSTLDDQTAIETLKRALRRAGGDPDPAYPGQPDPPLRWYDEDLEPAFFAAVEALLATYTASPGATPADLAPLREGVPQPASELRQVPPV